MPKNKKKDIKKRNKALAKDILRKDWFETIIRDIDEIERIYYDFRMKGYVRDAHESAMRIKISTYLANDRELMKFALDYFAQTKLNGERARIKMVEGHIKSLEKVLAKDISHSTKEKLINHEEEEVKTQIPGDIAKSYLQMLLPMKEKYLK